MLNLHHLRLFRAVARDGTLTGAARSLNISQSAVSTQIKSLESTIGHALFERRGRNIVLTEAGRIALDHAEEIFRTAENLTATLKNADAKHQAIRIGALATLSRNFQMAFLEPVIGRDDVEIILRSGSQETLLVGLESLALDVVLTNLIPARDASSAYRVHRLAEQSLSLIGSPERNVGGDLREALTDHPVIVPTAETALRAGIDAMFDRLGLSPRIVAEVDDMAMIRLLTRANVGLAIIPPIVVQDELASGKLVEISKVDGVTETFCAVTMQRKFPNPLLAEILKARA